MRATGRHGLHLTCLQADPSLPCTGADAGGMRPQFQQAAPTVPAPFRLGCDTSFPDGSTVCIHKLSDMEQRFCSPNCALLLLNRQPQPAQPLAVPLCTNPCSFPQD